MNSRNPHGATTFWTTLKPMPLRTSATPQPVQKERGKKNIKSFYTSFHVIIIIFFLVSHHQYLFVWCVNSARSLLYQRFIWEERKWPLTTAATIPCQCWQGRNHLVALRVSVWREITTFRCQHPTDGEGWVVSQKGVKAGREGASSTPGEWTRSCHIKFVCLSLSLSISSLSSPAPYMTSSSGDSTLATAPRLICCLVMFHSDLRAG